MEDDDIFSCVNEFCRDDKLKTNSTIVKLNSAFEDVNDDKDLEFLSDSKEILPDLSAITVPSVSTSKESNVRRSNRLQKEATDTSESVSNIFSVINKTTKNTRNNKSVKPSTSTGNKSRRTRKKNQTEGNINLNCSSSTNTSLQETSGSREVQANISPSLQRILEQTLSSSRQRSTSRRQKSTPKNGKRNRRNTNNQNKQSLPLNNLTQSQGRNSSRNFIGERAARAQVVGYVDLVSSPIVLPQTREPIDLDSDEEKTGTRKSSFMMNESLDETEKTPLSVKVKWGKKIEIFPYRNFQKFSDIIKYFAKQEKVNKENICLNLDDYIISENDTPDSIDYKRHMFINGRIVEDSIICSSNHNVKDPNSIEVKVQCDGKKNPVIISLKKSNKFSVLYNKCAEEFNVPVSNVKLSFDGDVLNSNSDPEELGLDGGEIIDCIIKC